MFIKTQRWEIKTEGKRKILGFKKVLFFKRKALEKNVKLKQLQLSPSLTGENKIKMFAAKDGKWISVVTFCG